MMEQALCDALAHARAEYPRESCGLMVQVGRKRLYVPCRNAADSGTDQFVILPEDYLAASEQGEVVGVAHSHPGASGQPSVTDVASHAANGHHWTIIGLPYGPDGEPDIVELPPAGLLPLEGRVFRHCIADCYTLIRDYYKQVRDIVLPDFYRPEDWWSKGLDLYVENFGKAGFVPVDSPQNGDVVLMSILSPVSNHGAIWLEGDIMLHHLTNRLSCKEVYGRYYRERTTHFLRYAGAA